MGSSSRPLVVNAGKAISEPAVFVAGTDTGVGKTVVSALLAAAAAARGAEAGYLKPVQTGVVQSLEAAKRGHPLEGLEDLYAERLDADFVSTVAASAGLHVETKTSFCLPLPAAPWVAASEAGSAIDVQKIDADFQSLQERCDYVVVEGAGGLLVPLTRDMTMADLAWELGVALVVVCRVSLGTLNHTLLTVEAANRRGLSVLGLAFARVPGKLSAVEKMNLEILPELTGLETLLVIPEDPELDVESSRPGSLADLARQVPKGFSSPKKI